MEKKTAIDILKQAILLEKRGHSFYTSVAEQAKDPEIKEVFSAMAEEETIHVKFLSEQFIHYAKNKKFLKMTLPGVMNEKIANLVLSDEIKNKISVAGMEAAAITAAIEMEKRAIETYSTQAQNTSDPAEKDLYQWLAEWEKTHLEILTNLDNELKEKIWFDNHFWPF